MSELRAIAERVAEEVRTALPGRLVLDADRARVGDLALESVPVTEAILEGSPATASPAGRPPPELREAFALTSLLGRRAAALGVSPTGVLGLFELLVEAWASHRPPVAPLSEALRAVLVEGYVGGHDEIHDARADRRAAAAIAVVELAPRCLGVFVTGTQGADAMEAVFDDVGRRLLARDARSCLVDAGGLVGADRERAAAFFGLQASCRMLGVRSVVSRLDASWVDAAEAGGIDLGDVQLVPDFEAALAEALAFAGQPAARQPVGLAAALRRLLGAKPERS